MPTVYFVSQIDHDNFNKSGEYDIYPNRWTSYEPPLYSGSEPLEHIIGKLAEENIESLRAEGIDIDAVMREYDEYTAACDQQSIATVADSVAREATDAALARIDKRLHTTKQSRGACGDELAYKLHNLIEEAVKQHLNGAW